ncbi:Pimeloyl-ACP methyl ester carboxylesterase [Granulicella pectinivorans]|uniref:Pimeloyl-ACP methyl ester carboxylesterase n=1 Tax=Granulicella pectinivorans TaxID=474950 RepID=A0A1I6M1W4_9BACT|nr:alpha/beta hydrolase [Granulicella pectinivorans]SFS09624.1 Pimeloyl-ACP methyl ester carboxylesterase [Granulicella pectinivorans]
MTFRSMMAMVVFGAASLPCALAQAPTRFTVTVEGKGPDVVLLPGLASSRAVYDDEAKLLTPHYTLHRVQINGFAGSPAGPNAEGPLLMPIVEELHGYIAANKLHPAVIGHSLGGLLTLMLAAKYPGDIDKMMIVDALPFYGLVFNKDATVEMLKPQVDAMAGQMLAMPDDQFAAIQPMVVKTMVNSPEGQKAVAKSSITSDRTVYVHAMQEDMATDVRPSLASIKTPAVLIYPFDGTVVKDPAPITAVYTSAYATMPQIRFVKVDNSRHFIMYDQPAVFDAQVQAFLK